MAFGDSLSVIDNFNRSDGEPVAGWSQTRGSGHRFNILSNQLINDFGGTMFEYWDADEFGPAVEVAIDVPVISATQGHVIALWTRQKDQGSSSAVDGYVIKVTVRNAADRFQLMRVDNQTNTQLGSTHSRDIVAGDKIGLESTAGHVHTGYYDTGAGWVASGTATATDSTYTAAGECAVDIGDTTWRLDNFSAGTISVGGVDVEVPAGALTLTGYPPTVTVTEHVNIEVPVAALAMTGYAPTVATPVNVTVPVAALAMTGYAPGVAVTEHVDVEVPVAALAFTGYPPAVAATGHVDVEVPVAALAFTGYAPTVQAGGNIDIEVPAASLAITGYAPTIQAGGNIDIEIPVAAMALTGYAPTIAFTAHVDIEIPVAALNLTGYVPIIAVTSGTDIEIPAASLALTGFAPTLTITGHVDIEIPVAALTLTGYPPIITAGMVGIQITFSLATRTLEFSLIKREVDFDLAERSITFGLNEPD